MAKRRDNESRLEELEAQLGDKLRAPPPTDEETLLEHFKEAIKESMRDHAQFAALSREGKIAHLRARLEELRAHPPEPPAGGALTLIDNDAEWHVHRIRLIELDIAELEGVQPHLLWVARQLTNDAMRYRERLPPNPIPTHEEALAVIESGKLEYCWMPASLKDWRLEQHGKVWVLLDPQMRRERARAAEAALPPPEEQEPPPGDHPMLEAPKRDRLREYRGTPRDPFIEPSRV